MGRIPVDVQFLLESILSESPDQIWMGRMSALDLNDAGVPMKQGIFRWEHLHAIPFFVDPKNGILIFRERKTHGTLENFLNFAAPRAKFPPGFDKRYNISKKHGSIGLVDKSNPEENAYFFGISDEDSLKKYLKDNEDYLRDLKIRGGKAVADDNALEISGRVWTDRNIISFWNEKARIEPQLTLIYKFLRSLGMDPQKTAYEFIDIKHYFTYQEINDGVEVDDSKKLSPEEIKDLQKAQHLKKDKKLYGKEYWKVHGDKAAKGFNYAAQANAAIPALENHVKLKDLIKRN